MTLTPKTLIHHCLIGLSVRIVQSTNSLYNNITGIIVDETKNTLTIKTQTNEKQIPKTSCVFQFRLSDKLLVEVKGNLLLGRPEERIKKKITYKWNN